MVEHSPASGWRRTSAAAAGVTAAALVGLGFWVLGQPGDSSGADLSQVRAASPTPTVTEPASSTARTLPRATARDASLASLDASAASPPARIAIPDLGVDATVDDVGVQEDGAMVIPAEPTSVGWYRYGSAPEDDRGNTVIAGHVATREDGPGALASLRGAEPGMRLTVTTADGTEHEYEVRGREAIVKKALPVDEIFARDGRPLLVLITCGGEYNPQLRSHRDNIVVTATPVG
ncbi:class F sortase [Fodinibacter luteus]|uniref:Class F sortase n=1 Tax=Fodinibacter luteus TaxID=552064 RepID=A0ABP8K259_9MICO